MFLKCIDIYYLYFEQYCGTKTKTALFFFLTERDGSTISFKSIIHVYIA
jgi:hypothetical protein